MTKNCIQCPDWTEWESDLKKAAVKDATPIDDETLDRFRHALADVHCKSSSAERHEVEYRLQRFGAKLWRRILARLDAAEAADRTAEMEALRADKARLDYLDRCNAALNARYGTTYWWKLVQSHNVNRLMIGDFAVDLHDSEPHGLPSCRDAIDERLREASR